MKMVSLTYSPLLPLLLLLASFISIHTSAGVTASRILSHVDEIDSNDIRLLKKSKSPKSSKAPKKAKSKKPDVDKKSKNSKKCKNKLKQTNGGGSDESTTVTILHMNDSHSHLDSESFGFDCSILSLECDEAEVVYGGFPMIASLMKEMTDEKTIKLHAGDVITGTAFFTLFGGRADGVLMQSLCFDALTIGNHEFDKGDR